MAWPFWSVTRTAGASATGVPATPVWVVGLAATTLVARGASVPPSPLHAANSTTSAPIAATRRR